MYDWEFTFATVDQRISVPGCAGKPEAQRRALRQAQQINPDISADDILRCRAVPAIPTQLLPPELPAIKAASFVHRVLQLWRF